MQSTMMDYPLTIQTLLERAGRVFPEVEIVSRLPDKSLHRHTYADFYRRSRALAEALQKAGVKRGDRVATLMWNHYGHLEAYFAVPVIGAVLHTLNLRLHPDDIAYIANHAGDRYLIIDDVLLPLLEKFRDQVDFERIIVFPFSGETPEGHDNYEDLIASATGDFEYPELDEREACGMCYTSGTTGRPKGVVYSHRSTVLHAFGGALNDVLGLSMRDVAVPVVPMFHVNAWGIPYLATMVGSKQVYPGPHMDPVSLLDLYEQEKVTVAAGVPTIWLGILQALDKEPERWNLVEGMRMTVGGAAPPKALIQGLDKHGLNVYTGWGMTETSPLGSLARIKPSLDHLSTDERFDYRAQAGIPVPFMDIRVMGDEGEAPWDGESVGELQVRGPWVTGSYYNLPQSDDKFTEDGWFCTGDVAHITPEGYIHITDRTKDLIKSGGEWISSVELENEIMAHPAVAEAAVIAVSDDKWSERPLAVVVLKEGQQVSEDELREHLEGKVAKWWIPDVFVFADEIPRTSTGKFLKTELRKQYGDYKGKG